MCQFSNGCKNGPEFKIIHKRVASRPAFIREACGDCASKIGARSPQGKVIDLPGAENSFYRIVSL